MKKKITILTPTFNEASNIEELHRRISKVINNKYKKYKFEHFIIDNASTDGTIEKIKKIAKKDKKVKAIFNMKNYGIVDSMMHAWKQVNTDACIHIASDLQDPPEVIPQLIKKWEDGYKIVVLVKEESEEKKIIFLFRKFYYHFLTRISETPPIKNSTGNGLIDRDVIKIISNIKDPLPFFRGLLVEIGFPIAKVYFKQSQRNKGTSANSFYDLYDFAMMGVTNHSKLPIRILSIFGFILSLISFVLAIIYLFLKFIFWDSFEAGVAPILIGLFFFASIQMFFLGVIGEYIAVIYTRVRGKPPVIESERTNF
ncbi:MAG: glycosyltransferase [Pelagibacteraceae bacterium]|nr:glycosyltransferase [Pelagibacteraceae bacterium]